MPVGLLWELGVPAVLSVGSFVLRHYPSAVVWGFDLWAYWRSKPATAALAPECSPCPPCVCSAGAVGFTGSQAELGLLAAGAALDLLREQVHHALLSSGAAHSEHHLCDE